MHHSIYFCYLITIYQYINIEYLFLIFYVYDFINSNQNKINHHKIYCLVTKIKIKAITQYLVRMCNSLNHLFLFLCQYY